ncbi:hypothetical protein EJ08DRAFT_730425 [Tothia fuscella]|uniref:GIY-YIG domain-containing protein n=1 Tax=Tothia fuscella TaxID=1048955 RepID=A0A9P4NZQ6_9PEZI|nr:hypothetical protein EJ08DRAFT_730425 [Tothia fuscella]
MEAPTNPLIDFLVGVVWLLLQTDPSIIPEYSIVFNSSEVLDQFFVTITDMEVTPGLYDVLCATTAPTLDFFKDLPSPRSYHWGVYIIVMEKLYCGSATSARGIKKRFTQYESSMALPSNVQKSLDEGYSTTHKGVLLRIPLPDPVNTPEYRMLILALEALFSFVFWTMVDKPSNYGLLHMRGWGHMDYEGLCTHTCPYEGHGLVGLPLTTEQRVVKAVRQKEHVKEYDRFRHHQLWVNDREKYNETRRKAYWKIVSTTEGRSRLNQARMTYYYKAKADDVEEKSGLRG